MGAFNGAASDTFTPATQADMPPQANDAKCGRVPHDREDQRLRVHGLREAVNDMAARYGFAVRTNPGYDNHAATQSFDEARRFLATHLS